MLYRYQFMWFTVKFDAKLYNFFFNFQWNYFPLLFAVYFHHISIPGPVKVCNGKILGTMKWYLIHHDQCQSFNNQPQQAWKHSSCKDQTILESASQYLNYHECIHLFLSITLLLSFCFAQIILRHIGVFKSWRSGWYWQ